MRTGIADYRATKGNRGVYVLLGREQEHVHFLLLTFWESYEAIRGFASDDISAARYYPRDRDYLVELEPCVTHYEVLGLPEIG